MTKDACLLRHLEKKKCGVTRYRTAGRLRVRAGRMVKPGKARKQELESGRSKQDRDIQIKK